MYAIKDIYCTMLEAHAVIEAMQKLIKDNEWVSVADFYQMCDVESSYGDELFGWRHVSTQNIIEGSPIGTTFRFEEPTPRPSYMITELSLGDHVVRSMDFHPEQTPVGPFNTRQEAEDWFFSKVRGRGSGSFTISPVVHPW